MNNPTSASAAETTVQLTIGNKIVEFAPDKDYIISGYKLLHIIALIHEVSQKYSLPNDNKSLAAIIKEIAENPYSNDTKA